METISVVDLGLVPYQIAYQKQQKLHSESLKEGGHFLILCEHPPVITLGRLSQRENVLADTGKLKEMKVQVEEIDRGGDVTIHFPGQLIVYPIINLNNKYKDVKYYLRKLEDVIIDLLKDFDILSERFSDRTGVWVASKKIASIGIGVKKWITFHGLALNVKQDPGFYCLINPCGLGCQMTSMEDLLEQPIQTDSLKKKLIGKFCSHFDFVINQEVQDIIKKD